MQFHLETTPLSASEIAAHCRAELLPSEYVQPEVTILGASQEQYQTINSLMGNILSFLTGLEVVSETPPDRRMSGPLLRFGHGPGLCHATRAVLSHAGVTASMPLLSLLSRCVVLRCGLLSPHVRRKSPPVFHRPALCSRRKSDNPGTAVTCRSPFSVHRAMLRQKL